MKWWWTPWRKRAWLKQEERYRDARWHLHCVAIQDPLRFKEEQAICESLKPEGWTRGIERRRWNVRNPRMRRWAA